MANYNVRFLRVNFEKDENFIIESFNFNNPQLETFNVLEGSDKVVLDYSRIYNIFSKDTPTLNLTLKVQNILSDSEMQKISSQYFNYIVLYTSSHFWCYFIDNVTALTPSTAQVNLSMDTLNTYSSWVVNENNYDDRTLIIREHIDRYLDSGSTETNLHAVGKIDRIDEQINLPLMRNQKRALSITNDKWFIIYKTRDDLTPDNLSNPVECYITSDHQFSIANTGSQVSITYSWYDLDKLKTDNIFLSCTGNSHVVIRSSGVYIGEVDLPNSNITILYNFEWYKGSTLNFIRLWKRNSASSDWAQIQNFEPYENPVEPNNITFTFTFDISDTLYYYCVSKSIIDETEKDTITITWLRQQGTTYDYRVTGESLMTIDNIDRTDGRLMKIIECPEAPITLSINGEILSIKDSNANFDSKTKLIKINNIGKEFNSVDLGYIELPRDTCIYSLEISSLESEKINNFTKILKMNMFEPKLYNSSFYEDKLSYGGTSILFEWENYSEGELNSPLVHCLYKQTNTINSNFLIFFKTTIGNYVTSQDFGEYAIVSRNNELPIFTNSYIDYIRTGYNYDKANIEIAKKQSLTTSISNALFSFIPGSFDTSINNYEVANRTFTQISNVTSGAIGIYNSIKDYEKSKNSMQAKLDTLAYQATNVIGSNDIDLLNTYNEQGKICYFHFEPIDELKEQIERLFYYYGYRRGLSGKPNWHSRSLFNYVQANVRWVWNVESEDLEPIDASIRNDITEKIAQGVTTIHRVNIVYEPQTGVITPRKGYYFPRFSSYSNNTEEKRNNFETWIYDKYMKN